MSHLQEQISTKYRVRGVRRGSRTTHDAQACIEMHIKSDALSAESSGQFSSVLVRVLTKKGPHSHNAIPYRLHLLPALHPSLHSPLHSRPLSPPQINLFQKTRCQTNENLCHRVSCSRQQSPGGSVEASRMNFNEQHTRYEFQ